jgi:hypothetical protein
MAQSFSQAPRQALILSGKNPLERAVLHNIREQSSSILVVDVFRQQLREWIKAEHPGRPLSEEEMNEQISLHSDGTDDEKNGSWVYYPWRNTLVHCLAKEEFIRVGPDHHVSIKHTSKDEVREHYKLTDPPDNDGKTYMLHFGPFALGPQEFAVQVSSWEADIIGRQLAELYREEDE